MKLRVEMAVNGTHFHLPSQMNHPREISTHSAIQSTDLLHTRGRGGRQMCIFGTRLVQSHLCLGNWMEICTDCLSISWSRERERDSWCCRWSFLNVHRWHNSYIKDQRTAQQCLLWSRKHFLLTFLVRATVKLPKLYSPLFQGPEIGFDMRSMEGFKAIM